MFNVEALEQFTRQHNGFTWLIHTYFSRHLTNNDFNVFISNFYTLRAVN